MNRNVLLSIDTKSKAFKSAYYGTGSTPMSDVAKEAARCAANPPPAIEQSAHVKNYLYYEKTLEAITDKCATDYRRVLAEYKASGAWRENYDTWDDACEIGLEQSRRQINKLLQHNEKVGQKRPIDQEENPPNSQQSQQDTKSESNKQSKDEKERPPKDKSGSKSERNGEPEAAPVLDKTGHAIPSYALEYWNRGSEVQHVLSALSDMRTTIRKANEAGDRLWCAFDTQDLLLSFDALYTSVSNFLPYAVCKKCNGLEAKILCSMCHGTGLINKVTYGFNKS